MEHHRSLMHGKDSGPRTMILTQNEPRSDSKINSGTRANDLNGQRSKENPKSAHKVQENQLVEKNLQKVMG